MRSILKSPWLWLALLTAGAVFLEIRTSAVQALAFSRYASTISYDLKSGPSDAITFPKGGPFDQNRGYPEIPEFVARLKPSGFVIAQQARDSSELMRLINWGIYPPYDQPAITGLKIRSSDGRLLRDVADSRPVFESFEEIPPIVVRAVLFIENRELVSEDSSRQNPAVEWDRLGKAGLFYFGKFVGLPLRTEGGSTLAVQLEKYRHSPGGQTRSASEKLRQILAASLRSYRSGTDTREERRKIVLEYLNTIPLAAQVGYGEVHGIGEGLHAWLGRDFDSELEQLSSSDPDQRAEALKSMLALLCAVRAPTYYLITNRSALEARITKYVLLMREEGTIDAATAEAVIRAPLELLNRAPSATLVRASQREVYPIRVRLLKELGVNSFYDLDRLHLEVNTTIDAALQDEVTRLLASMKDPQFVDAHGLRGERLIGNQDPKAIVYGVTLFERTPEGNLLRVQADTLDSSFNLSDGMKMELGSTAKLRTLAHYMEILELLYSGHETLSTNDPLTVWAKETLQAPMTLDQFLQLGLDRKYSTSTGEGFFTGGGLHSFGNFEEDMEVQRMTVREAFRSSVNLVFIRLMRDIVRFHVARLPYDTERLLNDPDYEVRKTMLKEVADGEATTILSRAYTNLRGLTEDEMLKRLLRLRATSIRHLTILFFAWNPHAGSAELQQWLQRRIGEVPLDVAEDMKDSYEPSRLNLMDYAYLARLHPLEIWCAGVLRQNPGISLSELLAQSKEAKELSSTWLFKTKNRRAQDLRLRTRIEQDAFARMTPYWQRLGFPFDNLVPSLATAIGSSSDRPSALAELMGIILNDGVRLPSVRVTAMRFAAGTPYETALVHGETTRQQVMHPAIAHALRGVLSDVIQHGTAQRLADAFVLPDGSRLEAGGKTGSGDNRYYAHDRSGHVWSANTPTRTATFVFYIGHKYFGVVTAYVKGAATDRYTFTSALAVAFLKILSPSLTARLNN